MELPMTVIPFERFQLTDRDASAIIARCYSLIAKGIAEGWERLVSDEGEEAICILGARDGYGIYTLRRARSGRYYVHDAAGQRLAEAADIERKGVVEGKRGSVS